MQKSTSYLLIGVVSLIALTGLGFCVATAMLVGDDEPETRTVGVVGAEVNLEKLTTAFERHVGSQSQDLNAFEATVNDASSGIYEGDGHVSVTMRQDGEVVGFLNQNQAPTYEPGEDKKVFSLQVEQEQKRVVAHDSGQRYYSYYPSSSGFFTGYLIGSMLSNQRGFYGGGYYTAPPTANWVKPGYHSQLKSSYRSPSVRSGSYGRNTSPSVSPSRSTSSPSRSGSRSGGSGFGK